MTSDEIQKSDIDPRATFYWLKEIAYQLAVMNEHRNDEWRWEQERYWDEQERLNAKSSGSKVGAGSESEVRGDRWRGELCRRGFHRFDGPVRNDSRCLNCGWTSGEIFTAQHEENVRAGMEYKANERTTPPNPQTTSIQTKET
jgi:hypothetical protein